MTLVHLSDPGGTVPGSPTDPRHPLTTWTDPYDRLRADPAITVDWRAPLRPPEQGRCYPRWRTILIRAGLTQAQRRVALAHELAHLDHHDSGDEQGRDAVRADTRADVAAAHRLIPLPALLSALAWTTHEDELAEELRVTVECLRVRMYHLHPAERAMIATATD